LTHSVKDGSGGSENKNPLSNRGFIFAFSQPPNETDKEQSACGEGKYE
jgi:hypothetical protein